MTKVELYVYDLSNGLAKQLSRQLTGRQIDGIWHTSVVVYGKEIFYGQGISITEPGKSHHGRPLQVVDMGETAIDEATFEEYLSEMREHYTADKYHLLDFNCNSFTNDVVGFLTGGSIPSWIKDLPSDFLSTPFGAALRPTIDNMYRRPVPGATPTPPAGIAQSAANAAAASPNPQLAASLLQAVAAQAAGGQQLPTPSPSGTSTPSTQTVAAPIHMVTNPASWHSTLKSHRAVTAFFTSATCGPCRMIEPIFEEIARNKTQGRSPGQVAFAKIDLGTGMSSQVASEYGVRVTPTFIFFLDGKKIHEMKGADGPELRTQVDLLLYQAFPPHPHQSLSLPAVESLSLNPILFQQVPAFDNVLNKLNGFIEASQTWPSAPSKDHVQAAFTKVILPYLKARFPSTPEAQKKATPAVPATTILLNKWAEITGVLAEALLPAELFPVADLWRLALLDEVVGGWAAAANNVPAGSCDPVVTLLSKAALTADDPKARNYLLVVLRMLSNAFATPSLARRLLTQDSTLREQLTSFLVRTLLHDEVAVRTAAASLAFNVAAYLQKLRVERVRSGGSIDADGGDGDWEVEMVSAVVEAIGRETQSEEVLHRLTACLAFLLRLSPLYEEHLGPLLEVVQASSTLKGKLEKGGCGENGVTKKDIRQLITEVAEKLCP
ncbi:DUF862-domain-containing protein [Gloeophyllum trabeum ATCC 11539]|uniref:DUF862-domain-containing protein n=1 Tax=Gloeophyllum trabeum (strain ATCC 11539 / FP-39264 / Madison 617) TaxID=670483 RepID=S7Q3S1_GLOTA|nr:DUF862-domain-containing protein [Gloeophyllum trabeum ATCC 11539]EPQ54651.1 DUF862-domain-containing protein [Gloeophyllum trabeum ATCC 11539]